ncbi:transposase [Stutzerimonas stutzeri]|uniref:transposase n=1 Tax=Stutzerimonas stutzeri TaxID=316 RepID=UPI00210946AB|nr:transposase [Stutzerimonas stutzeri]MCQ4320349.1 transposase [Stutzerimonas stutzeri]
MSAQRVSHSYDLMDAAHCSPVIRAHSQQSPGHVPQIDHNPRGGSKLDFAPQQAQRFKERSTVEGVNGRLKDGFGISRVNVRGHAKMMTQMMVAVLALAAEQLLPWVT